MDLGSGDEVRWGSGIFHQLFHFLLASLSVWRGIAHFQIEGIGQVGHFPVLWVMIPIVNRVHHHVTVGRILALRHNKPVALPPSVVACIPNFEMIIPDKAGLGGMSSATVDLLRLLSPAATEDHDSTA